MNAIAVQCLSDGLLINISPREGNDSLEFPLIVHNQSDSGWSTTLLEKTL